jgi:hypothetical protein
MLLIIGLIIYTFITMLGEFAVSHFLHVQDEY